MASQTVSDLLGAIERIGPLIGEHALAAEADRRLSGAVHQAMYDAGLFAMLAPKPMAVWSCTRPTAFGYGKRLRASMPPPHGTW
jgi:hypothetical protein